MKKNLRKATSFIIAMVMVAAMVYPVAAADQAGVARVGECTCGGYVSKVTVFPSHTNERELVSCAGGTHYVATKGVQWICMTCERVYMSEIQSGHYCTKNGGHYCFGPCSCE